MCRPMSSSIPVMWIYVVHVMKSRFRDFIAYANSIELAWGNCHKSEWFWNLTFSAQGVKAKESVMSASLPQCLQTSSGMLLWRIMNVKGIHCYRKKNIVGKILYHFHISHIFFFSILELLLLFIFRFLSLYFLYQILLIQLL